MQKNLREVGDRVIDSHVKNMRGKLTGLVPEQDCISAVIGAGYRFDLP